ncbi:MAG: porin family protein [Rhizobiaceae bacterium]|nr:porin family protein [Rhizobiaceae bacterium]
MKRFALLLSAATAIVSPALAADVIYEEPPAPMAEVVATGWTGFYVGVQAGGAFNPSEPENIDLNFNGFTGAPVSAAFGNNFTSGFDSSFIGGAHVGYDQQFGQFVVGAVIDINAMDMNTKTSAFSNTPAFYTTERSLDYLATARLRAGYTVVPTALAYVTGGLAYGEVEYDFFTDSPAVTGNSRSLATARDASVDSDEDDFGYTIGGGMEVMVTESISFGAEYLYTNLGGSSSVTLDGGVFDGDTTNGGATNGNSTTFDNDDDFDFHTVTAKLSYRFN